MISKSYGLQEKSYGPGKVMVSTEKLWSPKKEWFHRKVMVSKKLWSHRTQTAMAKAVSYGYIYGCHQGMKSCGADGMAVECIRMAQNGFLWPVR